MTASNQIQPLEIDDDASQQWARPPEVKPKKSTITRPPVGLHEHRPSRPTKSTLVRPPVVIHESQRTLAPHLYQLCVATPLPTIDLSNTLVSWCSPRWIQWHNNLMYHHYKHITMFHRIASTTFLVPLALPPSIPRHIGTAFVFCAMLTMINPVIFMSVNVFKLLLHSHDYLFISAINLANWSCLAVMLGAFRSLMCFPSWFASQVAVSMDGNIRTFPTALRSIAITIPAVLSIALWCAFEVVHDPKHRVIYLGPRALALTNIFMYTSTTLSIFMGKKVLLKFTRSHSTFPHIQKIIMSKIMLTKVDAIDCFLPWRLRKRYITNDSTPLPWRFLIPTYIIGLFGFAALTAQFLGRILENKLALVPIEHKDVVYCSFVATVLSCSWISMHFQRDLVFSLRSNFDYIFSSMQVIAMVLCMVDMARWEQTQCLRIFSWAIWVQFALTIDALTPLMRRRLHFRMTFVAPIFCTLFPESFWFLLQAFLEAEGVNALDRKVFSLHVSSNHVFRMTNVELLAGQAITIFGWFGSRVIHEVVYADARDLIFIRGLVEYMSPYETFPPPKNQVTPTTPDQDDRPTDGDSSIPTSLPSSPPAAE